MRVSGQSKLPDVELALAQLGTRRQGYRWLGGRVGGFGACSVGVWSSRGARVPWMNEEVEG